MTTTEKCLNAEQLDTLRSELCKLVDKGKLSELGIKGCAKVLLELKDDEGDYLFYDSRQVPPNKKETVKLETFRKRVQQMVHNWRDELKDTMMNFLIEGTLKQAQKSKDSPASLKAAMAVIEPDNHGKRTNKPALSPSAEALLQRERVATVVVIGQDGSVTEMGNRGHERPDTVHTVADGQQDDTPLETVSLGHDSVVYELSERGDTAQGSVVPDTTVPPEDTVDNDSGADMGST